MHRVEDRESVMIVNPILKWLKRLVMAVMTLFRLAPNLVTNGDCELDSNWYGLPVDASPPTPAISTEQVHSGTYSMKIISTGMSGMWCENFIVSLGKTYRFQGWFYTASTAGSIWVYAYNGNRSGYTLNYPTVTSNTWCNFSIEKTMDVGGSSCKVAIYLADSGALYIDDISVTEV